MIDQHNFIILLIAVAVMAVLTALSRLLPFLLSDKSAIMHFFMQENSPLAPLGGAIIGAMTVVLALPFFMPNDNVPTQLVAVIAGSIATIIATLQGINTGLSVIIGMAGFLVGFFIRQLFV
ncbi:MAG: AzlD domain-containing protein [Moraxella sp.]|nr:AzlD domain-containing protein [Moraxella sp.]